MRLHFTFVQDRVLGAAIGLSIALHAALLSMHFKFPDTLRWKAPNNLSAKAMSKPAPLSLTQKTVSPSVTS